MPIVFTPAADRQFRKLPADVQDRIAEKLSAFAATGQGDVKRLQGRAGLRLRIGDWRVIFTREKDCIMVVAVGNRRDIYD